MNRFDRHVTETGIGFGAGFQLLETASYDPDEVNLLLGLLDLRRRHYGDGVIAVDCGANVGVHTIEWAKHMTGWGVVIAIEAQERIYYALAGNVAINNCFNARAIHAAVTSQPGAMKMPAPNYFAQGSFGSLELRKRGILPSSSASRSTIGKARWSTCRPSASIRSNFPRLDLIKIDIEGMELEALAGGVKCIGNLRPILVVEMIKTDREALRK